MIVVGTVPAAMKKFLETLITHRWTLRIGVVVAILFVLSISLEAVWLFWVKVSCEFHKGWLSDSVFIVFYGSTVGVMAMTLLQSVGGFGTGRYRRGIVMLLLLAAATCGGFYVFGEAAFYCFAEDLGIMLKQIFIQP